MPDRPALDSWLGRARAVTETCWADDQAKVAARGPRATSDQVRCTRPAVDGGLCVEHKAAFTGQPAPARVGFPPGLAQLGLKAAA